MVNIVTNTGLVIKVASTRELNREILDIINGFRSRCIIYTNIVNHTHEKIDPMVKILTGTSTDEAELINMGLANFPKNVGEVLFYDVKTSGINKKNLPTYDRKVFDAEYYMNMYPDIVLAGYNTPRLAYEHYTVHGTKEGRSCKAPVVAEIKPPTVWIYLPDEN